MPVIRARDGGDSACDCARLKQSGPVAQRLEQWTHNAFRGSARSCTALQSLTKSPTFPRNRLSCSARSRTETHARPRPSDTTSDTRISEVGEGPKPPPAVLGAHHPCDETSINRIVAVTRARITRYATDEYSPPSGDCLFRGFDRRDPVGDRLTRPPVSVVEVHDHAGHGSSGPTDRTLHTPPRPRPRIEHPKIDRLPNGIAC